MIIKIKTILERRMLLGKRWSFKFSTLNMPIGTNALWLIAGIIMLDWVWAQQAGLQFSGWEEKLVEIAGILLIALLCDSSGKYKRLAHILYYFSLWLVFFAAGSVLTYLAAHLNFPLYDSEFVRLDTKLGFNWMSWFSFVHSHLLLNNFLLIFYSSIVPQIIFSLFYFSNASRHQRNDELFLLASISLVITALISGFIPAVGTFQYFGVGLERAVHLPDLFALRDGSTSTFSLASLKGIVTLPSYHTVLAIIFAYAYRGSVLYLASYFINGLMLLSTPSHGGHYLTDMIAGSLVAIVSIIIVKKFDQSHNTSGGASRSGRQR